MKSLSAIVAILGLACAVLWGNRVELALGLIGVMAERRANVGPSQDISWATGGHPHGRVAGGVATGRRADPCRWLVVRDRRSSPSATR